MKTAALLTLVAWAGFTGLALHTVATPCQTEDSVMCYWDGETRGNGYGNSFIAVSETLTIRTK